MFFTQTGTDAQTHSMLAGCSATNLRAQSNATRTIISEIENLTGAGLGFTFKAVRQDSSATHAPCGSSWMARWMVAFVSGAGRVSSSTAAINRLLDAGFWPTGSTCPRAHLSTDETEGKGAPGEDMASVDTRAKARDDIYDSVSGNFL